MVDLEEISGSGTTEQIVNTMITALTAFSAKAKSKTMKTAITTGGAGFTAEICETLQLPTIPWNQDNADKCKAALARIFQAIEWDYWMPQMYDGSEFLQPVSLSVCPS